MFKNFTLPGFMLAAVMAFMAAPNAQVAAAECGGPGEVLCKENQACAGFFFFKQCTTKYDYWATEEPDGDEEILV